MIRKYKTDDIDALIAIWDKAEVLAHPFLPTEVRNQVREDMRSIYLPNAEIWVLETPLGAAYGHAGSIPEYAAFYLKPEFAQLVLKSPSCPRNPVGSR